MKAEKQQRKKRFFILAASGFAVVLLMFVFLYHMEFQNYNQKIDIISSMLEGQKQGADNLKTAAALLKGEKSFEHRYGRELLKSYGYMSGYKNTCFVQYKIHMLWTGSCLLLLYIGFLLVILGLDKKNRKKIYNEMETLGEVLVHFKKGIYEIDKGQCPSVIDRENERIYAELESLGDYLQLMQERMEQEKEETKSLVTDISHQLKTPVAALKTCFEILLQEDLKPEERKEFLDRYNQQMKGLEDLLSALISISRLETGMIQIKKETGCIYDTLVSAVNRIYLKAEEKQIDIGMEADDKLKKLILPHDGKWLCEAFINLLENAVKYSPSNTCVTIRMIERTTFLRIEVEDQGIGIPKEEYHLVFKRFYRGKSEEVKKQSGSGIGLYLTREIISRHGGTITVSAGSISGSGSKFIIQLPYQS